MEIYNYIKEYLDNTVPEGLLMYPDFQILPFWSFVPPTDDKEHFIERPHRRTFFEITVSVKDSCSTKIDNKLFQNIENTVFAISPYQIISVEPPKNHKEIEQSIKHDTGFSIMFNSSFLPGFSNNHEIQELFPYFKVHTNTNFAFNQEQMDKIVCLVEEMMEESNSCEPDSREMLQALFMKFLLTIKRFAKTMETVHTKDRFQSITSSFERMLIENQGTYSNVKEYATYLNVSAVYLGECVKKATGRTAKQLITGYRLLRAQSLLLQDNRMVAEIADELGFAETAGFVKFFKKHEGITPLQYRKKQYYK